MDDERVDLMTVVLSSDGEDLRVGIRVHELADEQPILMLEFAEVLHQAAEDLERRYG